MEYFTSSHPEWGVRELATQAGMNKSTTYRMLATMESLGVVRKNKENDRYALGVKLYELGSRVPLQDAFIEKTHPILTDVAASITETVHLGVLYDKEVLMIDKAESPMGLKLDSVIGTRSPLYCTGGGKVLLAHDVEMQEVISNLLLDRYTINSITDKKMLLDELNRVRSQGYAIDREEWELGLICVAVPVYNTTGVLVASLSASGPANRFREDALTEYLTILQNGAALIQEAIGPFNMKNVI